MTARTSRTKTKARRQGRGRGERSKPRRNSGSEHRSAATAAPGAAPALQLPEALDLLAAAPLAKSLIERRGASIAIDASSVQRVGAQCVQVLLSAASTWTADGHSLAIVNRSPGFVEGLQLLGIAGDSFIEGEVQQ
jgi:chemotaxis protein CheX